MYAKACIFHQQPEGFRCKKKKKRLLRLPQLYEGMQNGHHRHGYILKLLRPFVQVRRQSLLVRHEEVLADTEGWLSMLRQKYHLRIKAGFPRPVRTYKGEQDPVYNAHSEFNLLYDRSGRSKYWDATSLAFLRDNLDTELDSILGYHYGKVLADI